MRVIAGKLKGLKLNKFNNDNIRPTTDMVKEAIFSKIQFSLNNCMFLDLFGGTGAIGIEALSRGASEVIVCDNNNQSVELITENYKLAKCKANILKLDYKKAINKFIEEKTIFDIIFIDAPFHTDFGEDALNLISQCKILNNNGIVIFEHLYKNTINEEYNNLIKFDEKKYGTIAVSYFRYGN